MATSSYDVPAVRHFRNFVVISILVAFVLAICFYITGSLVVATINGDFHVIKQYLGLS